MGPRKGQSQWPYSVELCYHKSMLTALLPFNEYLFSKDKLALPKYMRVINGCLGRMHTLEPVLTTPTEDAKLLLSTLL